MTLARPDLPLLLLDLIALQRPFAAARAATLRDEEWQAINAVAASHRLQPLLDQRMTDDGTDIEVPDEVRAAWTDRRLFSTMRLLTLQRDLLTLHDMLTEAAAPYLALKGAYLAWHAYPEPGLRPLRDLDLLVPRDRALELFEQLLSRGYRRTKRYMGNAQAYLEISHQLPPLQSPSGNTVVELHTRLFHRDGRRSAVPDPSEDPGYWARSTERTMMGRAIRFPAVEDLLIHLIEHAVYGHQFDNGPLLFSDIAFLVASHSIDWPLFWRLADEAQCRRGARLSFALTRHYWPDTPFPPSTDGADAVPDDVLHAAALSSLRGHDHKAGDHLLVDARLTEGGARRTAHIWRRLFPERNNIALIYPVRANSPLVIYYYAKRLWTLATERLPSVLSALSGRRPHDTVDGLVLIHRWLEQRG